MNDREYLSAERAERRYAHGTRARYSLAKCRCFPCKVANADYETARQADRRQPFRMRCVGGGRIWQVRRTDTGEVVFSTSERSIAKRRRDSLNRRTDPPQPDNELISTGEVIAHVEALVAAGVGLRAVAIAAAVSRGVLQRIVRGTIQKTRRATADRILAVGTRDAQPGAYIDASETWELLDALIASGYTKTWIAQQLGAKGRALQLKRHRVSASNAFKVRELYEQVWRKDAALRSRLDPDSERERTRVQGREFAGRAQATPLSVRDPAIKRRWDALFSDASVPMRARLPSHYNSTSKGMGVDE